MNKPILLIAAVVLAGIGVVIWLLLAGGTGPIAKDPGQGADQGAARSADGAGSGDRDGAGAPGTAPAPRRLPPKPASGESFVTGRIVEAVTQTGIAGARLVLRHPLGMFAVTDESERDGSFVLEGVPAVVGARLFVAADGWGPRVQRDIHVPAHDRVDLGTIELSRGVPISGRVVSATGAPITGALVDLLSASPSTPGAIHDLVQVFRDLRQDDDALDEVITAADGTFSFTSASPGNYVLAARKPGWQLRFSPPVAIAAGQSAANVEIRLIEGKQLRGIVKNDSGAPVARAEISALELDHDNLLFPKSQKASTGADGRFAYATFGDGMIAIVVQAAGYSGASMSNLEAGRNEVEIVLKKAARIEGRVFDRATGKGLQGATVIAFRLDEEVALEETRSGPEGAYVIDAGPSGEHIGVFAKLPGYTMFEIAERMSSEESADAGEALFKPPNEFAAGTTVHHDLSMIAGGSIAGRLVDEITGQPIAGGEILAVPQTGIDFIAFADPAFARSGPDGTFTIPAIGAGKFALSAHAAGYVTSPMRPREGEGQSMATMPVVVEVSTGAAVANVTLKLGRGADVVVVVVDPAGNPLAGATVTWMIPDEQTVDIFGPKRRPRTVTTDGGGRASLKALPPRESILVAARHADYPAGGQVTVGTSPPPDKPTTLTLARGASIAGVVLDADGRPTPKLDVSFTAHEDKVAPAFGEWSVRGRRCFTDAAGKFLLENLPPGPGMISVHPTMIPRNSEDDPGLVAEIVIDPAQTSFDLVAGKREEVTLRLLKTLSISGVVRNAAGQPLPGVLVHAKRTDGADQESHAEGWGQTNERGEFTVGSLIAGNYQLNLAMATDKGPKTMTHAAPAGATGLEIRFE